MKKFFFLLLVPAFLFATSYYIDYENGGDNNSGLTKVLAWKHCPGMKTATSTAGAYDGNAGDNFVFKGGVVWQASEIDSMFPLSITFSSGWENGTAENPISFAVDSTWFSGQEYSMPVCDGGGILGSIFDIRYQDHFVIDGFEIRNHGVSGYLVGAVILSLSTGSVVQNCFIHDWVTLAVSDHKFGGIVIATSDSTLIENCHIRGDSVINSGLAIRTEGDYSEVSNCEIHMVPNGILGSGKVHDCHIYDIVSSFDAVMHENGIEMFSDCEVYNNIIHDVETGVTVYLAASFNSIFGTGYFYNNLIYDCGPIPVRLDPDSAIYHVYNNTVSHTSNNVIAVDRPAYEAMQSVHVKNNIFITTTDSFASSMELETQEILYYEVDYNSYTTLSNIVWSHNDYGRMTLAQAQSNGFDTNSIDVDPGIGADYKPNSAESAVVGAGVDLDSIFNFDLAGNPRIEGSWSMGAYEYESESDTVTIDSILQTKSSIKFYLDYNFDSVVVICSTYGSQTDSVVTEKDTVTIIGFCYGELITYKIKNLNTTVSINGTVSTLNSEPGVNSFRVLSKPDTIQIVFLMMANKQDSCSSFFKTGTLTNTSINAYSYTGVDTTTLTITTSPFNFGSLWYLKLPKAEYNTTPGDITMELLINSNETEETNLIRIIHGE